MLSRRHERGDTIVEVLFAVAVFALVVIGSLTLMNQGTATAQRSLESTLVRQQMDAQAETIRMMHESYVAVYQPGLTFNLTDAQTSPAEEWYRMIRYVQTNNVTSSTQFGYCPAYTSGDMPPAGSFVVDPQTVRVITRDRFPNSMRFPSVWAQVTRDNSGVVTAEGLWIEAIRSGPSADPAQSGIGFIDFHIRACWDSIGMQDPMHLGTIVRLYDPR